MIKGIEEIIYIEKNAFTNSNCFRIIISNNNLLICSGSKYSDFYQNNMVISNELLLNFYDGFFRIIDLWEESYISNDQLDSDLWQLSIKYSDGKIKNYYGKGLYPNNFDLFEEYIDSFVRRIMEGNL